MQSESLGSAFKFHDDYKNFGVTFHILFIRLLCLFIRFRRLLGQFALWNLSIKKIKNFDEKYLKMLELGGVEHHKELLEPFGLAINNEKFWQAGLDVIINYIDQLEEIV